MTHHPTLHSTGRHGCWAICTCNWRSRLWNTVVGAHLEFGRHLLTTHPDTQENPMTDTRDLTCPGCGRVNEAHDGTNTTEPPAPGDVSICWGCGALAFFTETGMRAASAAEEAELRTDPDIRAALGAIRESYNPSQAIELARGGRS